jgi:hypothetical protein
MTMRKAIIALALAALVAGAHPAPAAADVVVTVVVNKEKDISVFEQVEKFKFVQIEVFMEQVLAGAAEAQALVNQRNVENSTSPADPEIVGPHGAGEIDPNDMLIFRHALIADSINDNTGVVGVNQDVGNMVNQANVVALATTNSETALTHAQAEADQFNTDNTSFHRESSAFDIEDPEANPNLTATIEGSINGNAGVVGVNQNVGNMNNQANLVSVSVGLGSQFALSESALGQITVSNQVIEVQTVKFGVISNSVNDNSGVVGVNQSVGHMNNQASAVSVAALTSLDVSSLDGDDSDLRRRGSGRRDAGPRGGGGPRRRCCLGHDRGRPTCDREPGRGA